MALDVQLLSNLFKGSFKSTCTCKVCGYSSTVIDPIITLPLCHAESVTSALCLFTQEEQVIDWNCTQCENMGGSRKIVVDAGSFLVIQLKVFRNDGSKVMEPVKVDLEIDVTLKHFGLFACVYHNGESLLHGHYVCAVKGEDHWILCNDGDVKTKKSIEDCSKESKGTPYVLFYKDLRQAKELSHPGVGQKN